jgi:hypothetical protein
VTPWCRPSRRYALHEAPELAVLDALTLVVEISVATLEAACPELRAGEIPAWAPPRVWLAQAVISQSLGLRETMGRYRAAVCDELSRNAAAPHEAMPF